MISKINLDKVGIGASFLCAIHCALLPLLFTTLPMLSVELLENKKVELGFIVFSLIVGCSALYNGYSRHHHKTLPLFVFIAGIALLFIAHYLLEYNWETLVKIIGAITIIIAHTLNWHFCKQCSICKY